MFSHDKNLAIVNNTNFIFVDKIETISVVGDEERIETTKRVSVKQQFYTAFRTTTRILLNSFENRIIRTIILNVSKSDTLYTIKLNQIVKLLHKLLDSNVKFISMEKKVIMSFVDIIGCTQSRKSDYCLITDNINVLLVPDLNLVSSINNEKLYFAKMADELIRNRRTQLFMLEPNNFWFY